MFTNSTQKYLNMHKPYNLDDILADRLDSVVAGLSKRHYGKKVATSEKGPHNRSLRIWKSVSYKENNRDLPRILKTQALIYGYMRFRMQDNTQVFDMKLYNSTSSISSTKINIVSVANSIWSQPHVVKLKELYDQYKFTGFSIKFKHVGSMVQDDSTLAAVPTPIAVAITFSDPVETSFNELIVKKPSIILSLSDKRIGMNVPSPNVFRDADSSSPVFPISTW